MKIISFLTLTIFSLNVLATNYYIDPQGDDNAGFGSKKFPWKSLSKACSVVKMAGDTIWVNPGTYSETKESDLAPGVSVIGVNNLSIISAQISGDWNYVLKLNSKSEGTKGNQSIAFLSFEGNNSSWAAIQIDARSNVKIYNCNFTNFKHSGVTFNGKASAYDPVSPSVFATQNEFYNNTIENCAEFVFNSYGAGALQIGGQDGMLIYNNRIVQNSRADGYNGYCIKYYNDGYNKGLKIYNNVLIREAPTAYAWDWNFAIELWYGLGGIEIYNNTIYGSIDIVHGKKGNYDYALYVHNNTIGYESLQRNSTSANNGGIFIEREVEGIIVRGNIFRNIGSPIQIYPSGSDLVKDIEICYNLFNGIGIQSGGRNEALINWATVDGQRNVTVENFRFINNTVVVGNGGAGTGVRLPNIGKATNVTVRNNIIVGFEYHAIISDLNSPASISKLSVENNILFDNGTNEVYFSGVTPVGPVVRNNISQDPLFWSATNFHVKSGSPAIKSGLPISGLTTDLEGVQVSSAPNIGCYETLAESATPKYYSSAIYNETPDVIEITFDINLSDTVPETGAFMVKVNDMYRDISEVRISGGKLNLGIDNPVYTDDIVLASYNKPVESPLQSVTGIAAESFQDLPVTNMVKKKSTTTVQIQPNPSGEFVNIKVIGTKVQYPLIFKLINLSGNICLEDDINFPQEEIVIPNSEPAGIYIIQVFSKDEVIASHKHIIQR